VAGSANLAANGWQGARGRGNFLGERGWSVSTSAEAEDCDERSDPRNPRPSRYEGGAEHPRATAGVVWLARVVLAEADSLAENGSARNRCRRAPGPGFGAGGRAEHLASGHLVLQRNTGRPVTFRRARPVCLVAVSALSRGRKLERPTRSEATAPRDGQPGVGPRPITQTSRTP
jgi:hypothetical protein